MALKISKVLLLAVISLLHYHSIQSCRIVLTETSSYNSFAMDLFSGIVANKALENVIYSPASIQFSLAFLFSGAKGQTAEEMRKVLKLPQGDNDLILKNYKEFLESSLKASNSSGDAPQLKMANRLYVNIQLKIAPEFNKIAQDIFDAQAENVDFNKNQEAVDNINYWVEQQTENKIKNLLETDAVNGDTTAVLVNAIYFKAKWLHPFDADSTQKASFYINDKQKVEVDMMFTNGFFDYVELPELKATALKLPYKDSNISMLIILPNDRNGLEKLEIKLKHFDLNRITSKMLVRNLDVYLPKFRIEYDIDLKEPLRKLGLNSIFEDRANFSGLFDSDLPQQISDVKHKAFLDVNEAGSEAAAATYFGISLRFGIDAEEFHANHPFVFVIQSKSGVYFAGHVAKF